ncbi:MAG: recombinase family protein [Bacteroidales bacterium]|nr:recombinase family protein [Bacteroidales bacterium]
MIYAYIRVSTAEQSYSSQEFEIRNWAKQEGKTIDCWENESVSGTVEPNRRKLGRIIRRMKPEDLLVCTEISRLGRNMLMIMSILNDCASRNVRIHTIKDNFDLNNNINSKIIAFAFALAAEIERNLISQRTREALADLKAAGVKLGRPRGSYKQRDAVMQDLTEIRLRRTAGESYPSIAKRYGVHRNTLVKYLKSADYD